MAKRASKTNDYNYPFEHYYDGISPEIKEMTLEEIEAAIAEEEKKYPKTK